MSISFECEKCGQEYTTRDESAGKTGQCKQCGHRMLIPRPAWVDEAFPAVELTPTPESKSTAKAKAAEETQSSGRKVLTGALTVLIVVGAIGLKLYNRINKWANRQEAAAVRVLASAGDRNGPIETPRLPDVGPGRELEPGIMLHEVRLPGGDKPGFSGKLWLYLPSGEHAPKSLPCVMVTGAGSNLVTGMDLGDEDRAEHLPYVRAGFAVLAYELDGRVPDFASASEREKGITRFLAARAGLVNAHIALDFLLTRVPQVDPSRIYTAGHSSAGTTAMLFAEYEPAIRGCAAYAPAIDHEKRFGPDGVREFVKIGIDDLAVRYSPKNNESKLSCPILLFHARDDGNVPVVDTEASAERLKALGKTVTLVVVPSGGHYDGMINEGIPRGIAWLQDLAGLSPKEQPAAPAPAPAPAPAEAEGQARESSPAQAPNGNPVLPGKSRLRRPPPRVMPNSRLKSKLNDGVEK